MGFKQTSENIAISFGVDETAPGVLTSAEIALQLDVLNNEIFVVVAADLDVQTPDAVAGNNTDVTASITSTALPAGAVRPASLANTNCIAVGQLAIRAAGFVDSGVSFTRQAQESYTGSLDYIAIIATNNFTVSILGGGNAGAKGVDGRVFGFRARADSATYAALVQSEVLSA